MDKVRLLTDVDAAISSCKRDIRTFTNGYSKKGKQLSYGSAAFYRTKAKQRLKLLQLIRQLVIGELDIDTEETLYDFLEY